MSGSGGVSIARSAIRGENRFYNPPPMRRMMQQEAQLQQQMREKQRRQEEEEEEEEEEEAEILLDKERRVAATSAMPPPKSRKGQVLTESKNRVVSGSEVCAASSDSSSGSGRVQTDGSNLDRFLEHTTPLVPARFIPMRSRWEHKTRESEGHTYFVLEDLWESFVEWSAYGAGVPLQMHGSDSTVQYYVPYLSGIQLYVDASKKSRSPVEDNEVTSNGSSNGRVEKLSNNAKTLDNAVDLSAGELSRVSLRDQSVTDSVSSGETEISNPQGRLLFEYLEDRLPYCREPLANKVLDLASRFPELMTYRSCDLSPSSWFSVSWYPIYRIPVGASLQNLDACFLSFHPLSTAPPQSAMGCSDLEPSTKLPLPTFGLVSYKLKASVWNQNRTQESQKITSLQQAAEKCLKSLQVDHPDYRFFTSNSPQMR